MYNKVKPGDSYHLYLVEEASVIMKTLNLHCFEICIKYNDCNRAAATIQSNMKETNSEIDSNFNSAVEGLESLVLAHFSAGIDVTEAMYLEGIEVAYEAICNNVTA